MGTVTNSKSANPTHNDGIVVLTSPIASGIQYSHRNRWDSVAISGIDTRYSIRFDDPVYYGN